MRVLVVGNQKGGSGKTMLAANIAGALVEAGQSVLLIDLDPQAQLASALGAQNLLEYDEHGALTSPSIADVLVQRRGSRGLALGQAVQRTPFDGLDHVPGSDLLDEVRLSLETNPALGLRALQRALDPQSLGEQGLRYDWVVIDTAPKLDILLDNALVSADFVLAVLAPELQQAEPLSRFLGRVESVQESIHPGLHLLGVLFNKANYSWVATSAIPALLRDRGLPTLDTVIPMYAHLANSYGTGPVVLTAPNSRAAGVVRTAVGEILQHVADLPATVTA